MNLHPMESNEQAIFIVANNNQATLFSDCFVVGTPGNDQCFLAASKGEY
jgi:phosphotransacetylase